MTPAVATRAKARAKAISSAGSATAALPDFRSADELREVLERTLEAVERSSDAGTRLKAANLDIRVEVGDLGVVCWVKAAHDADRHIQWRFDRRGKSKPGFVLMMDSKTANAWFQGRESIPMAIARRRMRCSGNARDALRYLPLLKLISARYRKLVRSDYPHLAIS
jgi:hypothetical protein